MADLHIKDYLRETSVIQSRLLVASVVVIVLIGVLLVRLYNLQIARNEHFVTLSQHNRMDLVPLPPVRGVITDRNGEVLAQNFPVYNIEVLPDQVQDLDKMLDELGRLVTLSERDLKRFKRLLSRRPSFERHTLRTNLSDEEAARFAVNQHLFPGVDLRARLQRTYPKGPLAVHTVGYVGRISEKDLDRIDESAYRGTEYIGKLGVEDFYEEELLGQVGYEQVETNAHGRVIRQLSSSSPESGQALKLTLDSRLQTVATQRLLGRRGAIVALEPATGAILAFVSMPAYDPNPFVNGIDDKSYARLRESDDRPLLNRALNGRYAPGSTIKGFMALAALEAEIDPRQVTYCPGWYSLPNRKHRYRCWNKNGHGSMNMHDAIVHSCDVYFYRLAKNLGIDFIHQQLQRFGFSHPTNIDLNGEPSGLIPSREWKKRARDEVWYPGETVITGIGQGYMLVTPLQLAAATALVANRGVAITPHILASAELDDRAHSEGLERIRIRDVALKNPGFYDRVIDAMTDVVHGPRGTARAIGKDISYRIAGKTGTAQVVGIAQGEKYDEKNTAERFRDHSLFVAFAPVDEPKIAIAVVVENGGSGSRTAAPIAKTVIDAYLRDFVPRAAPTFALLH